jgi:hypothetical protein
LVFENSIYCGLSPFPDIAPGHQIPLNMRVLSILAAPGQV